MTPITVTEQGDIYGDGPRWLADFGGATLSVRAATADEAVAAAQAWYAQAGSSVLSTSTPEVSP